MISLHKRYRHESHMAFFPSLCNTTHSWYEWTRSTTTTGGIPMNASNDNTAATGLAGGGRLPRDPACTA